MSKPSLTYETAVKKMLILLGLLIISPLVMSFGIKALRIFKEAPKNILAYGLVVLGVCLILFTVYFGLRTFKTILAIIFKD